jgi:hypothetical protein
VVNRVWLYGLIAVGGVVAAGVPVAVASMGIPAAEHVPTRIVCAVATLTSSVSAQLAFLPPPAYRRWLRSRASA